MIPTVTGRAAAAVPHGSPAGFERGCRSRGGCAQHGSDRFLTCAEAAVVRRRDPALSSLPLDQPLPRTEGESGDAVPESVHGTVWGYRRGCRRASECPNWSRAAVTCSEARRRYVESYRRARLAGEGAPIVHGTSRGYLTGCRDRGSCPGDEDGRTCSEARSQYMRERRLAAGGLSRTMVDAESASRRIRDLRTMGLSLRRIAALAGVGRTTVTRIAAGAGRPVRIEKDIRARILALTLDQGLDH